MYIFFKYFLFLVCLTNYVFGNVKVNTDFEILEGKNSNFWRKLSDTDLYDLQFYKENYNRQISYLDNGDKSIARIPPVLHWIWLGPKPFPAESVELVQSWIALHPDWSFNFWTDNQERPLPVEGMVRRSVHELVSSPLYNFINKTSNFGERSDLARYIILSSEGGIYIDHDVRCYSSFDKLTRCFDFFVGLEPPHRNPGFTTRVFPCNAVIGTAPGHTILAKAMEEVQARWETIGRRYPGLDPKSSFARVLNRTFMSFADAVRQRLNTGEGRDIVFPASFFFPDRIFSPQEIAQLISQGRVLASHRFAATWVDAMPDKSSEDLLVSKLKTQRRKLNKKINFLERLLFINAFFTAIAFAFFLFRRKKNA